MTCCNCPCWPSLQKALWGNALPAVIGSPSFSEKEKRERSVLEGEGLSSPNLDAHACPDTRKSPAAEICLSLGDGAIRLLPNVCGYFPGRALIISEEQALFFFFFFEMLPLVECLECSRGVQDPSIFPLNISCTPLYTAAVSPNLFTSIQDKLAVMPLRA